MKILTAVVTIANIQILSIYEKCSFDRKYNATKGIKEGKQLSVQFAKCKRYAPHHRYD